MTRPSTYLKAGRCLSCAAKFRYPAHRRRSRVRDHCSSECRRAAKVREGLRPWGPLRLTPAQQKQFAAILLKKILPPSYYTSSPAFQNLVDLTS